jgi:HEAT repeat protein
MSRRFCSIAAALLFAPASAAVVAAQQPRILNATVTSRPAGSPFDQTFSTLVSSQPDVAWIGYSVPLVAGDRRICCGSGSVHITGGIVMADDAACCAACRLEPASDRRAAATTSQGPAGPVKLEGADRLVVLFRIADRRVERVRTFSEDCELDAGGRPVAWLTEVRPGDSIQLLESLVQTGSDRTSRVIDGAIAAIALHADPAADASLDRLVAASQPESVRKKVTFWMGQARGARGLNALQRVLRDDPSPAVRKSAVFGVSQSREPGGFDLLASLARTAEDAVIRSEAVFWISQRDDARAPQIVLEVLEKDPARDVRKKAVFALSQLKNDAGIDALIRVARTGADPGVRGEAIFWLGQKAGARASAAITQRIEQDPDTDVKKRAVFALSQFPKGEGIPHLIEVARTNKNPEVRKQAMFWLAQSRDPRAVDFFAEILK